MSTHIHKPDRSFLPLLVSALLGVALALLLCSLLAIGVYRGAISEKGSRYLALLCPMIASTVAALRSFSNRSSALVKQSLLLLLLSSILYLPLQFAFSGGITGVKESFSVLLRCLCGILLGCIGSLQKNTKRSKGSGMKQFGAVHKRRST